MADIDHLSRLARIKLDEAEKSKLSAEFDVILRYIARLSEAPISTTEESDSFPQKAKSGGRENVWRGDINPHSPGAFSQELMEEAPETEDGYVKVNKIL